MSNEIFSLIILKLESVAYLRNLIESKENISYAF
jgi:hypothetical protein